MKTSSVLLLAGALVLAAGSALVARALMRPPPPVTVVKEVQVEPPATRKVLVAARDLVPGEFLDGNALKWRDVPIDELRAGDVQASQDNERGVYGATLRRPVSAQAALSQDILVRPQDPGFLSAVLQPGMRAISVPTSTVASNAGLVSAGDYVDVILSLERDGVVVAKEPDQPPPLAAETILRNVRVLALGDRVNSLAPGQESQPSSEARQTRQYFETITLEVNPRAAEKLAVAKELGILHVALRRVGEQDDELGQDALGVTRLADTTGIFKSRSTGAAPPSVATYKGKEASRVVFSPAQ